MHDAFIRYCILYEHSTGNLLTNQHLHLSFFSPPRTVPNLYKALMACRADLAAVWVAQYKVWPAVDWFNFTYVPEPLRVLFIGFITLFWNCYLATMLAHGAHS
jgi:hypothetical protein